PNQPHNFVMKGVQRMPRTPKKSKHTSEKEPVVLTLPSNYEGISTEEVELALAGLEETPESGRFPSILPLLPIREQVYFPHSMFPLLVGREKSVRALEEAAAQHRHILLVTQSNFQAEDPDPDDIYTVGIAAEIMQVLRVPDGTVRVMLEGLERCRIVKYLQTEPFYRVLVEPMPTEEIKDLPTEALMRSVINQFEHIVS